MPGHPASRPARPLTASRKHGLFLLDLGDLFELQNRKQRGKRQAGAVEGIDVRQLAVQECLFGDEKAFSASRRSSNVREPMRNWSK